MKEVIAVSDLDRTPLQGCRVEVDPYVPLRFRSYEGTLGVKYIRIGNFSGSLLEFLLDPISMTLRGFTLSCFDETQDPRSLAELPRTTGLPVAACAEDFVGPVDAQRIDIRKPFLVGFGEGFVEIDLGGLSGARQIVAGGPVEFYLNSGYLVGLRVVGLTKQQISMVKAQQSA